MKYVYVLLTLKALFHPLFVPLDVQWTVYRCRET